MIEFYFDKRKEKELFDFELEMFAKYKKLIGSYNHLFEEAGCELNLRMEWRNENQKIYSRNRISIENGYGCYIQCLVEKGGDVIKVKCNDGEADYYLIETSWMISSVYRYFRKLRVSLYTDLEDVDSDISELLTQSRELFRSTGKG